MKTTYSPKAFGALIGRSTITLQRWDREGRLPAHRSPVSNRRFYTHDQYLQYMGMQTESQQLVIVYTRVSGKAQKPDLLNQVKALEQFCSEQALGVDEWMQDIGSGLNYKRKAFLHLFDLIEQGRVNTLVIAHRDRLVRFGYEWFEAFCERHGTTIVVMNNEKLSPEREMVEDLLAIVTVFSARFHGLRSYKRTLEKAVEHAESQEDQA
ncbi:MAG: IS607 family transposase [Ktedonobacteraceae bacterium]|nr:IS607 family transposase [Ktedonobacteraceae bacterium]